jgi:uncharacterized protein DUF4276
MSRDVKIVIAAEDVLSIEIAVKILAENGQFNVVNTINAHGYGDLKKNIRSYHNMAHNGLPSLVITDLDRNECAPALISEWLGIEPHCNFLFRVAVREIEAWLLADRKGIAKFLGIRMSKIPNSPEELDDPKQVLINLARSGKKRINDALVPAQNSTAQIGVEYNIELTRFIRSSWNINKAKEQSNSLNRTIERIKQLAIHQE